MDETLKGDATVDDADQIQAEIQHYLQEIEQAQERMKPDQAEIERLKARTRSMLAELRELSVIPS